MNPTVLVFNKNDDDIAQVEYVDISIIKSKIDDLTLKYDFDQNLLFLTATCITLTKYTNSTEIFIKTKFNINSKSIEFPLKFHDDNLKRSVFDYIVNLRDNISITGDCDELLNELAGQSHFNYRVLDRTKF